MNCGSAEICTNMKSTRLSEMHHDTVDLIGNGTGGSRGALGTGSVFRVLGETLIELARPRT